MNNNDIQNLSQIAIKSAITKDWDKAIETNQKILEISPNDIPTLNRLGIAYSMSNNNKLAIETFNTVVKLDPKNNIAKNNLSRLKISKSTPLFNPDIKNISFIEEPGQSKIIPLVNGGEPKVISTINIGDPVEIIALKYKIKVLSKDKQFIGYIPDIISHRLIQLIKLGNKYKAVVKSTNPKNLQVFVSETYSSKRLKGLPSFPLDENEQLPNLSAGEVPSTPLEIFDSSLGSDN